MSNDHPTAIRQIVQDLLRKKGQSVDIGDTDSLFDSGYLDSMSALNVMMTLEADFGVDLSDPDFDISSIDTIADIVSLVENREVCV